MTNQQLNQEYTDKAKELFDMVYQWGKVRIIVDHTAPAYQKTIKELLDLQKK